jgi:hypothetical protein
LEADVAAYIEQKLASDKKLKEKSVINELLRKGIKLDETKGVPRFQIHGFKSKLAPGITTQRLEELLDEI